ncbi:hypothetical protein CARUB_v10025688mg, partial [Capsella rubella]
LGRRKKVRTNKSEFKAGSSSSDDNNSFFVLVTDANLKADSLNLPKDYTYSSVLNKTCHKIVLTDGSNNSWELDLKFNQFSGCFYITRGWRHFCDENGKKAGNVFTFELTNRGETPLLTFSPSNSTLSYETSEGLDKFVTYIPADFLGKHGLDIETRMVTLLRKDGTRMLATLSREYSTSNLGRMSLTRGWRQFVKASHLKEGEHITFECIWQNATPILKLTETKSNIPIKRSRKKYTRASKKVSTVSTKPNVGKEPEKDKNMEEPIITALLPPTEDSRVVTEPLMNDEKEPEKDKNMEEPISALLPPTENNRVVTEPNRNDGKEPKKDKNMEEPISPLLPPTENNRVVTEPNRNDGKESEKDKNMEEPRSPLKPPTENNRVVTESNRNDGKELEKDNNMEEPRSPLQPPTENNRVVTEPNRDDGKELEKDQNIEEPTSPLISSLIQNRRVVVLPLVPADVKASTLWLPRKFMKDNGINKIGKIVMWGRNEVESWCGFLLSKDGMVAVGCGWENFCETNGVKIGESFSLEFIMRRADATPVLQFKPKSRS